MKRYLLLLTLPFLACLVFAQQVDEFKPVPRIPASATPKPPQFLGNKQTTNFPASDLKEMEEATRLYREISEKHPERLQRVKRMIVQANEQPDIKAELDAVKKKVRAYVLKNDPEDIDLLEAMTRQKELYTKYNHAANGVY